MALNPLLYTEKVVQSFLRYQLVRIHRTLRSTPAMAAGVAGRLWTVEDLVRLTD